MTYVITNDEIWEGLDPETADLLDAWLVKEGDCVDAGQPIALVVLVKANYEITAPASGVISNIMVADQDSFSQGQHLAESA